MLIRQIIMLAKKEKKKEKQHQKKKDRLVSDHKQCGKQVELNFRA